MLAAFVALVVALSAPPARAAGFAPGSTCHATAAAGETYAQVAADPARWTCSNKDWDISGERAFVRFDLRGRTGPAPTMFVTRLNRLDRLDLFAFGADGAIATRSVAGSKMVPATGAWRMSAALPRLAERPVAVVASLERPYHAGLLSDARLTGAAGARGNGMIFELLIAALCGMLVMPLLFNVMFYAVLRERFLLWHAAAVVMMLVQTLFSSGLVNEIVALPFSAIRVLSAASFGGCIAAAALFSADFIEEGKLGPQHRLLLRGTGLWIAPWTLLYLEPFEALRPYAWAAYYAGFVPVLIMLIWTMVVAWRCGSRAVNFQIAAWAPFMLMGAARIVSALGLTDRPMEFQVEQHLSIAWEVVVTALGVVDRFLIIRRQRDRAVAAARTLEARADGDALTGLLNRRGFEARFPTLQAEGFHTMALIDLDHFKQINDRHGHAVGDAVLRAVAEALAPDEKTVAARLGGEEFVLLLAGKDAHDRAERRRRAIPARVAAAVPGLESVVTASMGLVANDVHSAAGRNFNALFEHCDRLLYEAKRCGRNRTMSERMRGFGRTPRRKAAA